ncbi:unnamed protein product [Albugo candida]|uniref:Uncharacterized protein n=1 Tax=Albugo candida TaxID=65357 RepID=A0A024GQW0_9STRA|nr:unnamed protein product [Albugo candida]|eukprot:CCI49291.1 unnamed protein product [Albugo candida]
MLASTRNATPSTMKRVGGGYVLRAHPTDTSVRTPTRQRVARPTPITTTTTTTPPTTTTTRTARANAPRDGTISTTARFLRTPPTRTNPTGRTSTLARVPATNAARATATRRASPVMTRGTESTTTRAPAVRPGPITSTQTRPRPITATQTRLDENARLKNENAQLKNDNAQLKNDNAQLKNENAQLKNENAQLKNDNAQLKNDNAQLSRALLNTTTQLQDATKEVSKLKMDVEELEKSLHASRKRNVMNQSKLDDAMKIHEEDAYQLKQLTDGHEQLKRELHKSNTMIQDLKIYMEVQQNQLDNMQKTHGTKTSVSTGVQTTAMGTQSNSREHLYRLQHEEDEIKMKDMIKENMELKTEVVKSRSMLEDFEDFMNNQLASLDANKEFSPTDAVATEAAGNIECEQGVAVHGQKIHLENGLITSLRMKVYMLEVKLKDSEYNKELLQMQLDKFAIGNWNSDEKRDFVPDWNSSSLDYQLQSDSDVSWTPSASSECPIASLPNSNTSGTSSASVQRPHHVIEQ